MHLQPVFQDCVMRGGAVSADLFRRGLCLPSGSALTDHDRERIVDAVRGCPDDRRAGRVTAGCASSTSTSTTATRR